mgnify:CR=1 FL=1
MSEVSNNQVFGVPSQNPDLRDSILSVSKQHFNGLISKHVMNVEVLLQKGVGVAEHPDYMETIEKELGQIAHYKDLLDVVEEYFE